MRKYLTEFVGTMFFVLVISLVVTTGNPMAPLAIGTTLMVVVYMGGHISGGHYNPAVTLAVFLRGKLPAGEVLPYWVAQIAGATLGAYFSYMFLDRTFALAPAAVSTTMTALMVEGLFTFLLCLTVLNVATSKATEGNSFYGLAIGSVIVVGAFAGGSISGGAFNPAVASGPTIVHALMGGGDLAQLWMYFVGPLAGGALAAAVFKIQEAAE
jgi:aquaporin Z